MSKRYVDSNPLYTPAKSKPGQLEIPVVTWHPRCVKCGDGFFCDLFHCNVAEILCPKCSPLSHKELLRRQDEAEQAAWEREEERREAQRAQEYLERNRQIPLLTIERQPL